MCCAFFWISLGWWEDARDLARTRCAMRSMRNNVLTILFFVLPLFSPDMNSSSDSVDQENDAWTNLIAASHALCRSIEDMRTRQPNSNNQNREGVHIPTANLNRFKEGKISWGLVNLCCTFADLYI